MVKVILPELGEGIKEATICYWHASEGKSVKRDEDLVEIATDKATFNVPAPSSGVIRKIFHKDGDIVKVGGLIAEIDEKD
ncbi:MAG: biotin/lipoyl-binding protein [Candidatus Omnitrophica bacterium]|nr:biotin/lipoyl-binding protein [Candidatus Omnitrophota bacterium]